MQRKRVRRLFLRSGNLLVISPYAWTLAGGGCCRSQSGNPIRKHLHQHAAGGAGCIDRFCKRPEFRTGGADPFENGQKVFELAGQAVELPDDERIAGIPRTNISASNGTAYLGGAGG